MHGQKEGKGDECQSVSNLLRLISLSIIAIASFLLITIQPAYATLYDRGNGLIYDDALNITWLQDANYAKTSGYDDDGTMTWYNSMSWAQNLVYGGYADWRLPSALNHDGSGPCWAYAWETHCTGSELGHLYYTELGNTGPLRYGGNTAPFINMQVYSYWFSAEATPDQNLREGYADNVAWEFAFHNSEQLAHNNKNNPDLYAWAVRDGDVSQPSTSVPEPSAFLLLGSGLAGFAFLRKRLKP